MLGLGLAFACLAATGCADEEALTAEERALLETLGPLGDPLPSRSNAVADDADAIELGTWLFFDDGLSKPGTAVGCADCHQPALGWSDDRVTSTSANETQSARHSITLTNLAYNELMFWNGRADSPWAQAYKAWLGVHAIGKAEMVTYLAADPEYLALYEPLFGPLPDPATASEEELDAVLVNCAKAIEAFERTIVSKNSALDRWIAGDESALTAQQLRGARLFVGEGGCVECHSGPNLSDGWFHNLGLAPGSDGNTAAEGLQVTLSDADFNRAGTWSDDPEWGAAKLADLQARVDGAGDALVGAHKTPTLRDVALRPRFGHNGEVTSLRDWIARYRDAPMDEGAVGTPDPAYVPRDLSEGDIDDLVAFMDALTGDPSSADVAF